jgi:hypothetical protein
MYNKPLNAQLAYQNVIATGIEHFYHAIFFVLIVIFMPINISAVEDITMLATTALCLYNKDNNRSQNVATFRDRVLKGIAFLSKNKYTSIFVLIYVIINALLKQIFVPMFDLHFTYKQEKVYYIQFVFLGCSLVSHWYPWAMTLEAGLTALALNIDNGHTLSQLFLGHTEFFNYFHNRLNRFKHSPNALVRWFGTQAALGSVKGPSGAGPNGKVGLLILGVAITGKLVGTGFDKWREYAAFSADELRKDADELRKASAFSADERRKDADEQRKASAFSADERRKDADEQRKASAFSADEARKDSNSNATKRANRGFWPFNG